MLRPFFSILFCVCSGFCSSCKDLSLRLLFVTFCLSFHCVISFLSTKLSFWHEYGFMFLHFYFVVHPLNQVNDFSTSIDSKPSRRSDGNENVDDFAYRQRIFNAMEMRKKYKNKMNVERRRRRMNIHK